MVRRLILLSCLAALTPVPAPLRAQPAQAGPSAFATEAIDRGVFKEGEVRRLEGRFRSWRIVCDEVVRLKQRFCSLSTIGADAAGLPVAGLIVSTSDEGRPAALIHLPHGVALSQGVEVVAGPPAGSAALREKAPGGGKSAGKPRRSEAALKLAFPSCDAQGCMTLWNSDAGANRRASGGRHAADTVLDAAGAEFLADAAGRPAAFPHGHRCRWRRLRGRNKGFGEQRPHAKLTSQLPWLPVSRSFYTGGKLCLDKFNGPPANRWRLASKYPYRLYRSAAVFACELRVGIYQPVGVEAVGFANASISRNMSKFASSGGFNDFNGLQVRSGRLLPAGKDNLV